MENLLTTELVNLLITTSVVFLEVCSLFTTTIPPKLGSLDKFQIHKQYRRTRNNPKKNNPVS